MLSPIVDPTRLPPVAHLLWLDARTGSAFAAGHAPGAVRVPIEGWLSASRRPESALDETAYWADAIARLGIGEGTQAIVYDDGKLTDAARVWFILQFFGANAAIADGGWPTVAAVADLPPSATSPRGPFVARPGSGPVGLADRDGLRAAVEGGSATLDVRSRAEFAGTDLRSNARGGHLPGARLAAHVDFMEGTRVKPVAEVRALLAAAGFGPDETVITYCESGARAALIAALAVAAGFTRVSNYYMSYSDWSRDPACPVVS